MRSASPLWGQAEAASTTADNLGVVASAAMKETFDARQLLKTLRGQTAQMVSCLRQVVECESPSLEKAAADRCCALLAKEWRGLGARVERLAQKKRGDHLRIEWSPAGTASRSRRQVLVLGHYDTVYASGTLRTMPFRVKGGRAYGPGVFDMKAGIVQALFAFRALLALRVPLHERIVFLWTSDEEIGSGSSRALLEAEARRSEAVLVTEPAFGARGLLKTSRKGVGEAQLIVHGRASHAGLAPQDGVNAIHELALQISRVEKWNDLKRGISVNADIVEGGSRTNVIADRARAVFDLRALRVADMREVEKRLRALRPLHRGARLEFRGGFDRPPLERTMSAQLYAKAQACAAELEIRIGECCAGGGSDGNLTAAL
ncbi:MAG TPA: M20/M25/M40 family metallo-hydrolase, partial [Candidatus Dormibacteraeota bacterium]|nr:M20/M25/M40 family metallo-hydrolase [Candidatus Dormibacteraeota bacterium]